MLIKIILIASMALLFLAFSRRSHTVRTQATKRIGFVLFVVFMCYAVVRPQDVTWVANRLGVGRGTDLVLYVLVVVFAFYALNTYLKFRTLERRFTDLARAVALNGAQPPVAGSVAEPVAEPVADAVAGPGPAVPSGAGEDERQPVAAVTDGGAR